MIIHNVTDLYGLPKGGTYQLVNVDHFTNFVVDGPNGLVAIPDVHAAFVVPEQPVDCPAYDYLRRVEANFGTVDIDEYTDGEIDDPNDLHGALFNMSAMFMRNKGYAYILTSENKIVKTRSNVPFHFMSCASFTPLMMCAWNLLHHKSLLGGKDTWEEGNLKSAEEIFRIKVCSKNAQLLDRNVDYYAINIQNKCWLIENAGGRRVWLDIDAFDPVKDDAPKENLDWVAHKILDALPPALYEEYEDYDYSDAKKALLAAKKFIGC